MGQNQTGRREQNEDLAAALAGTRISPAEAAAGDSTTARQTRARALRFTWPTGVGLLYLALASAPTLAGFLAWCI
jgi:hypothetical protein